MAAYKNPTFQERAALAAEAKQKALEKLKARPPIDPAVLAERQAARLAREAKEAEARAAKKAAIEQAKADKIAEAERLRRSRRRQGREADPLAHRGRAQGRA